MSREHLHLLAQWDLSRRLAVIYGAVSVTGSVCPGSIGGIMLLTWLTSQCLGEHFSRREWGQEPPWRLFKAVIKISGG